jgi:TonB family protein
MRTGAPLAVRGGAAREAGSLALGTGFTLLLFLAMAQVGRDQVAEPAPDLAALRAVAVPLDVPPPQPWEDAPPRPEAAPFAGLELGAEPSAMKIAAVPLDLGELAAAPARAPAAAIQPARLYTEFRPRVEVAADQQYVFQQHEVDQRPAVLARPTPFIPPIVRGGAATLRVTLLILIDARGQVQSVRILEPSGNARFDEIIVRDIREAWVFSPAVKQGRKVRCLLQQTVRVNWDGRSPFEL